MAITKTPGRYDDTLKCWVAGTEVTETTYEGRVLRVYNADFRAMSDVYTLATYAEVLRDDGTVGAVLVNANFECDTSGGRATVDATEEVKLAAAAYEEKVRLEREAKEAAAQAHRQALRIEEERNRPVVGKKMTVASGRKVKPGTQGTVAFISSATGKVLLKDHDKWQDRQANGVWVDPRHLKAS